MVVAKSDGGYEELQCGYWSGNAGVWAVAENSRAKKFQFCQRTLDVRWWSDGRSPSDIRWLSDVRCLGDFGHGMNNSFSWWRMVERSNSSDFVDGKGWGGWGKLDPHVANQIHGSNPTKLHHTNKSQKKLGLFLVGICNNGEEHNKIKLENKG